MEQAADVRALAVLGWHRALMGAWDSGPFDNDDAADFAGDISETADAHRVAARLEEALTSVTNADGYVDAPDMNEALAAAAIVAVLMYPELPVPSSLDQSWIDAARVAPPAHLSGAATHLFARAFQPQDNEWYELWAEADLVDEVRDRMTPYSSALA
jgi:hypothetical protein